jgi:tetratricopeptide (TPR) repeat protein
MDHTMATSAGESDTRASNSLRKASVDALARFEQTGGIEDLETAIGVLEKAVQLLPESHIDRRLFFQDFGFALQRRFEQFRMTGDLDRVIDAYQKATELTAKDDPDRCILTYNLGRASHERFGISQTLMDLEVAIDCLEESVKLNAFPSPMGRAMCLNSLGIALQNRFERSRSLSHLSQAIIAKTDAVKSVPENNPNRGMYLINLGYALQLRFTETGFLEDLDAGIKANDEAVKATAANHPNFAVYLQTLSQSLWLRFQKTGSIEDIDAAIKAAEDMLNLVPNKLDILNYIAVLRGNKLERSESLEDFNVAIRMIDQMLNSTPWDHPDRPIFLNNHANLLRARFQLTGAIEDLNAAESQISEALRLTPSDRIDDRLSYENCRSVVLISRFESTGDLADLQSAISVLKNILELVPSGIQHQEPYLNNLSLALLRRFESIGVTDDLNEAIVYCTASLEVTYEPSKRAARLNNLGLALRKRFERHGSTIDLPSALSALREATELVPCGNPSRPMYLNNLGAVLIRMFEEKLGTVTHLHTAVQVFQEAVNSTPRLSPARAMYLNSLGGALRIRFEAAGSLEDIDSAVEALAAAANLVSVQHPCKALYLSNLGGAWKTQFGVTGGESAIKSAINATEEAIRITPEDHPNQAGYLKNLAFIYGSQFEQTRSLQQGEAAIAAIEKAVNCSLSPPLVRITSAIWGANFPYLQHHLQRTNALLTTAVELLSTLNPRVLNHADLQLLLTKVASLPSKAAAFSIRCEGNAYTTVRLLELARGLIAGIHFDTHSDITQLSKADNELAKKFCLLCTELNQTFDVSAEPVVPTSAALVAHSQISRRHHASKELDDLLKLIRSKLEGFENFLLCPSDVQLQALGSPGPVVFLNCSSVGSDAFLVTEAGIRRIELPNLISSDLAIKAEELITCLEKYSMRTRSQTNATLARLLEWLWDVAVEPVLEDLGYGTQPKVNDEWPHVWWIPVGLLGLFPIHAAGYHSDIGAGRTALDRVISSYTPTMRALAYARNQRTRRPIETQQKIMLATMPETPNRGALKFAIWRWRRW